LREFGKRHFFHRLADDVVQQRAVVHDPALPDVNSVMRVTKPGSDEVRTQWRFVT
jgi:hypothetical protein